MSTPRPKRCIQRERHKTLTTLLTFLLLTLGVPALAIEPNPDFSAEEVLRIQLDALRENDQPNSDAGISTTFAFTSPENRRATGPLAKFKTLFTNPGYSALINHRSALYSKPLPVSREDVHIQLVLIISAEYGNQVYHWLLSKQSEGEYKDCWMTDGVAPVLMSSEQIEEIFNYRPQLAI